MYATDGDDILGGSDFDLCLYDIIKDKVLHVYIVIVMILIELYF